jgi:hypothetical protein
MMLAFHSLPQLKAAKLTQVLAHQKADEIVKGLYWQNGKGCAVGCTVHSDSHSAYETEMGIPRMLARLEDRIFEGMPNADAKLFPARFIDAIPVGADLSLVGWKFLHWLVADVVARHGTDNVKAATVDAIDILRRKADGEEVSSVDARNVAATAKKAYAADAAAAAAAYAADAAAAAAAAYADAAATTAAAYAAAAAAAAAAADAAAAYAAAADAAAAAADADAAAAAARQQSCKRQSEKLLELLSQAPVPA